MSAPDPASLARYQRQLVLPGIGLAGQRALLAARALVVGVGGLGSWSAELLARAGVGFLRLADPDKVDLTNLHRQGLYDQADALAGRLKVEAAVERLGRINSQVAVEGCPQRVDAGNIAELAGDVDVVLDGTDNFLARYIINDFCVRTRRPWVFAGVVGTEAQVLVIQSGRTGCLRCLLSEPPPPCVDPNCRQAGAFGPAVAVVAALQAGQAIKILAGHCEQASETLLKMDLWTNAIQQIAVAPQADCPCCRGGDFEYL